MQPARQDIDLLVEVFNRAQCRVQFRLHHRHVGPPEHRVMRIELFQIETGAWPGNKFFGVGDDTVREYQLRTPIRITGAFDCDHIFDQMYDPR